MSTLHSFAPDGSSVLVHMPAVGVIRCDLKSPTSTSTGGHKGKIAFLANSEGVQFLTHSTNGAYVVTWERAAKAAAEGEAQPAAES